MWIVNDWIKVVKEGWIRANGHSDIIPPFIERWEGVGGGCSGWARGGFLSRAQPGGGFDGRSGATSRTVSHCEGRDARTAPWWTGRRTRRTARCPLHRESELSACPARLALQLHLDGSAPGQHGGSRGENFTHLRPLFTDAVFNRWHCGSAGSGSGSLNVHGEYKCCANCSKLEQKCNFNGAES